MYEYTPSVEHKKVVQNMQREVDCAKADLDAYNKKAEKSQSTFEVLKEYYEYKVSESSDVSSMPIWSLVPSLQIAYSGQK